MENQTLKASELEEFRNALLSAFDLQELRTLLFYKLERKHIQDFGDGLNRESVVDDVIPTSERQGWLPKLILEAYKFNKTNPHLRIFFQRIGPRFAINNKAFAAELTSDSVTDIYGKVKEREPVAARSLERASLSRVQSGQKKIDNDNFIIDFDLTEQESTLLNNLYNEDRVLCFSLPYYEQDVLKNFLLARFVKCIERYRDKRCESRDLFINVKKNANDFESDAPSIIESRLRKVYKCSVEELVSTLKRDMVFLVMNKSLSSGEAIEEATTFYGEVKRIMSQNLKHKNIHFVILWANLFHERFDCTDFKTMGPIKITQEQMIGWFMDKLEGKYPPEKVHDIVTNYVRPGLINHEDNVAGALGVMREAVAHLNGRRSTYGS